MHVEAYAWSVIRPAVICWHKRDVAGYPTCIHGCTYGNLDRPGTCIDVLLLNCAAAHAALEAAIQWPSEAQNSVCIRR